MVSGIRGGGMQWELAAAGASCSIVCAIAGCSSQPASTGNDASLPPPVGDAGAASDAGGNARDDAETGYDAAVDQVAEAAAPTTCSPATSLDPRRPWEDCVGGACLCRTYAPDGGSLVLDYSRNTNMSITSFLLTDPMKAGQPYSLSVSVASSRYYGTIEFWGSNAECGPGLEKLYSAPVDTKVYCADVLPTNDYTYALLVERLMVDSGAPASEHSGNMLACPSGRCPKAQ